VVNDWFHPEFECLFKPKRYKVFYGGRGGLKSWSVSRALVLLASQRPLRVLCGRELQKSIKESVHQLLEGQIKRMGLEGFFEIQRDTIKGLPGTTAEGSEFIFLGLHRNASAVKSYEDIDICWVEEAANVSDSSWKYLTPTIRKPDGGPFGFGSEIWITFNPELESDATFKRFVLGFPLGESERAFVQKTTYVDNPFLSDEMRLEIKADLDANLDTYLHVWEGHCKQTLEGAVYADELRDLTREERIRHVPYDHQWPVRTIWDLGRSDMTSIWFVQRVGFEWHVIDFYENRLKDPDHYFSLLRKKSYVYDSLFLPHDGKAKHLGTKMSVEEQARAKFGDIVRVLKRQSISDKIAAARTIFPNCYFDREKCADGIQHLRHYTYEVKEDGQFSQNPKHDEHSHAASAWEYFGLSSGLAVNGVGERSERVKKKLDLGRVAGVLDSATAWMGSGARR